MPLGRLIGKGAQADVFEWAPGQVLKLYKHGIPLEHAKSEARNTGIANDFGIRVPRIYNVVTADGRSGVVMQRLNGPSLDQYLRSNLWAVGRYAREVAELHAKMHLSQVEGARDITEALSLRISRSSVLTEDTKAWAQAGLSQMPRLNNVLHFDFHGGNIIIDNGELYVIDWESPCTGDPLADVARSVLLTRIGRYHMGGGVMGFLISIFAGVFCRLYQEHYARITGRDIRDVSLWLPLVAAARTAEGFEAELPWLLSVVAKARATSA